MEYTGINELIDKFNRGKVYTTTSLQVADVFGINHDLLSWEIGEFDCNNEFYVQNFRHILVNGQDAYEITTDGLWLLIADFMRGKIILDSQRMDCFIGPNVN